MENYSKGKNVEEELERDKIPIPNLPLDFLWMKVSGGSKMKNLLQHALNNFGTSMVWSGSGPAIQKVVSCAEIVKRKIPVYQITKLCYRRIEEHWEPQLEGLEPIIVKRDIPTIHILLSKDPLDSKEPGYQGIQRGTETKPPNPSVSAKTKPSRRFTNTRRGDLLKQYTKKN